MLKFLKKINSKHILTVVVMAILIVCGTILTKGTVYENQILTDNDFETLRTWINEKNNIEVLLPKNFEYEGEKIVLKKTLNMENNFKDIPYVLITSKYYDYKLYLDNELVYEYKNPKSNFTTTNGTQMRIVQVGKDIKGKTLRWEIEPLLGDSMKYSIIAPIIGSKTDIVWNSIKKEQPQVIMDILIIVFGLVLLFLYYVMRGKDMGDKMFFLGMLSIICGVYMGCQYRVSHIIAPNSYLIYYAEYAALNLIPLIAAMFMRVSVYGKAKRVCNAMAVLFLINILFQNIMNFVFGVEFREMLTLTHILIILLAVVLVLTIVVYRKEKSVVYMLISLIPPVIGGLTDLIIVRKFITETATVLFPLGIYIFILMHAVQTIREYMAMNKKQMQSEIYERLAFTDGLTGLYNRLAFENDINERITDKKPACISVDLNNLKLANDTMGHSMGDILIKGMATILEQAVAEKGKIYRIGGDEFVVLIPDTDREDMKELLADIEACKRIYNKENRVNIDFAIGVSYFADEDESFETLVSRADLRMYKNKRESKENEENSN